MKKENTMLLNKQVKGQTISFTVWADTVDVIEAFIQKAVCIKGMPDTLKRQHDMSKGYWVNIEVLTDQFEEIIARIKSAFENDETNILCEDFTQTTWAADMLYV